MHSNVKKFIKAVAPPILLESLQSIGHSNNELAASKVQAGEKDAAWYDAAFEKNAHWSQHYSLSHYYFLWTVIADRILSSKSGAILEIGCGSGQLACLLKDKGVKNYHGFDFSSKRIAQARKACSEFCFSREDAFQTELFRNLDYTTVICTEFLEHVNEDLEVLGRIKSGSKFIGTVPNFSCASHVRYFNSENDVLNRYEKCFSDLRVDNFLANDRGKTFFMLDGTIL